MNIRVATQDKNVKVMLAVKEHLDQLYHIPKKRITKKERENIDEHNLLVVAFVNKWSERHAKRFMDEERVPADKASIIVHFVMDHVEIMDHGITVKPCGGHDEL